MLLKELSQCVFGISVRCLCIGSYVARCFCRVFRLSLQCTWITVVHYNLRKCLTMSTSGNCSVCCSEQWTSSMTTCLTGQCWSSRRVLPTHCQPASTTPQSHQLLTRIVSACCWYKSSRKSTYIQSAITVCSFVMWCLANFLYVRTLLSNVEHRAVCLSQLSLLFHIHKTPTVTFWSHNSLLPIPVITGHM